MLSNILTWVGAVLGIAVLLAMASGAFVLDFTDVRGWRGKKAAKPPEHHHPAEGMPTSPT